MLGKYRGRRNFQAYPGGSRGVHIGGTSVRRDQGSLRQVSGMLLQGSTVFANFYRGIILIHTGQRSWITKLLLVRGDKTLCVPVCFVTHFMLNHIFATMLIRW